LLGIIVASAYDATNLSTLAEIRQLRNDVEKIVAVDVVAFSVNKGNDSEANLQGSYRLHSVEGTTNTGSETNQVETPVSVQFLEGTAFPVLSTTGGGVTTFSLFADPDHRVKYVASPNVVTIGGFDSQLLESIPKLASANEDTCNGQLALVDCQDPTANWLFSGPQLFSAACWIAGHSAAMTVNEDCTSLELSLAANGAPHPITRAESFMLLEPSFIESIVDIPSVEEEELGSSYPYALSQEDTVGRVVSDRRLKHQITLINKSPSDIPIYSFQYRDGIKLADNKPLDTKSTFVGVMAQDLLELAPHAVTKNEEDGYYRVDYSKIDVDFGKL
jgi:hypothetical protein